MIYLVLHENVSKYSLSLIVLNTEFFSKLFLLLDFFTFIWFWITLWQLDIPCPGFQRALCIIVSFSFIFYCLLFLPKLNKVSKSSSLMELIIYISDSQQRPSWHETKRELPFWWLLSKSLNTPFSISIPILKDSMQPSYYSWRFTSVIQLLIKLTFIAPKKNVL